MKNIAEYALGSLPYGLSELIFENSEMHHWPFLHPNFSSLDPVEGKKLCFSNSIEKKNKVKLVFGKVNNTNNE